MMERNRNQQNGISEHHKYLEINPLPNDQWVKERILRTIRKWSELHKNKNTAYQNL